MKIMGWVHGRSCRIAQLSGLAVVFLAVVPAWGSAKKGPTEGQQQLIAIGPIGLGDLYLKMKKGPILRGGGPPEAAIVNSLNQCQVFIIDKKVFKKGEWEPAEKGFPKLTLGGKLSFVLKDKKGKDFEVQVSQLRTMGTCTVLGKQPCYRGFGIFLQLKVTARFVPNDPLVKALAHLSGLKDKDLKGATYGATISYCSDWNVTYDLNGKLRWPQKKAQRP
jgi:hypothetical protein